MLWGRFIVARIQKSSHFLSFFYIMEDTGIIVGIDLGTTYSEIYTYQNNQLEVIVGQNQTRTTPSRVIVSRTSTQNSISYLSGVRGSMQSRNLPGNEIYEPKRIIGRKMSDQYIIQDLYYYPFKIVEGPDDTPLYSVVGKEGDVTLSAIDVDAQILRTVASYRKNVKQAVITVPAYFRQEQIDATIKAGEQAGLVVRKCIPEPIAAAIAYWHAHHVKNQTIVVYDLGGGTFDCCLVRIENGKFKVLTSEGHSHLGGADFDNAIVQYIRDQIKAVQPTHDVFARKKDLRLLKDLAESAKKALSSAETYNVNFTTVDPLTRESFTYSEVFTRAEFNKLIDEDVNRTLNYIDRSLGQMGFTINNIDEVVVVGGSTRIPLIQQRLSSYFQRQIDFTLVNLDEAVAQGAAIYAAELVKGNDLIGEYTNSEVNMGPVSLIGDPIFSVPYDIVVNFGFKDQPVFAKGREIKDYIRVNRSGRLPYDHMKQFRLDVFKVTKEREKECIGILELDLDEPVERNSPVFSIVFNIDQYGVLSITGTNKNDLTSEKLNLTCRGDRLDNQIEQILFKKRYEAEQIWKRAMNKLCMKGNDPEVVQKRTRLFEISEEFPGMRFEEEDTVDELIRELKQIESS